MPVVVACTQCNSRFQAKDELAGRQVKCPRCQNVLQIPARAEPAAQAVATKTAVAQQPNPLPTSAGTSTTQPVAAKPVSRPVAKSKEQLDQAILNGFQSAIEPVRVPITYRFGVLLVSFVMLLLPLIYLGIIGLACYGVYYHAMHHTGIMGNARGRAAFFALLIYVAPMAVGAIMILFMVKPLFARSSHDRRTRSLTRDGEPLLFAFVDRLCEVVRAPQPKRIDVDCQVNASASFRRGFLSVLAGNDLVLTIGMPLAAGMSLRQFAGVLAHEFGHFSQGAGMRLTYLIRSISAWFTRVVYERDEWDEWLIGASQEMDLRISWILYLARFFIWLSRWILWGLMIAGHAVAGFLLRQMEFDADRHETRLAGSDCFESTVRSLLQLNFSYQLAQRDLGEFYREGRLGDNLPKLVMSNMDDLPDELNEKIDEIIQESQTGWFDTHPADKDRIANAQSEQAAGVFHIDEPASVLFRHFDAISQGVTWDFYKDIFGPKFQQSEMHSTDDLLQRQNKQKEAGKAVKRYFQDAILGWRFLRLPHRQLEPPSNPKQIAGLLKQARQNMLGILEGYTQTYEHFDKADDEFVEASQADAILGAHVDVAADDFETPLTNSSTVAKVLRAATSNMQKLAPQLEAFESSAGTRFYAALQLLQVPQVGQRVDDLAAHVHQCNQMFPVLSLLCQHHRDVLTLRNEHAKLAAICGKIQANADNGFFLNKVKAQMDTVYAAITDVRQPFANVMYPYDHAHGAMTVNTYFLKDMPLPDELGSVYDAAGEIIDKYVSLYLRLLGSLTVISEKVETALGLPRLEEPAPKQKVAN